MDAEGLPVEVWFLNTEEGGRRSPANLADGRYRPLVILGRHDTLPPLPTSEAEAEKVGLFGVMLLTGPSEVPPGSNALAQLRVPIYERGYERLKAAQEFTLLEGPRIVGHGRVCEGRTHAVYPAMDPTGLNRPACRAPSCAGGSSPRR